MFGWRSGQCKVKMAVLSSSRITEQNLIMLYVEKLQWEFSPIPITLFPYFYSQSHSLSHDSHCHSHSRKKPTGPTGSQLFPFPCTSLVRGHSRSFKLVPFESLGAVCYSLSMVTMASSCIMIFIARQHTDARYRYSKSVRPSVCPAVCPLRWGIRWKRLNISSQFFHHTVAQSF